MAVFVQSYKQAATFNPDKFNAVKLAENERARVIEACFEPGQFIPAHQPGVDLTLVVLEGTGALIAGDREEKLEPGSMAFIPAGERRGIRADTRLILFHVVTPPPTDADHAQVVAGLKKGAWK